jgi:polyprenyl-phospho-N-acetylgalactosaminyl synthase
MCSAFKGLPLRVAVLMPVFNERELLSETLRSISRHASPEFRVSVYLVDDGSVPAVNRDGLPEPSRYFDITLARHLLNLGQGAALETARRIALGDGEHEVFVTMDSDGQHDPANLQSLCAAIHAGADVAFGNRFQGQSNVPPLRRILLRAASKFERVLTGLPLEDSHNGYRAFGARAISLISMSQHRMAHATEIKQIIARAVPPLRVVEVPVSIRYTEDSLRKGQRSLGAVQIVLDLIYQFVFGETRRNP